jgi:hypothetical protein
MAEFEKLVDMLSETEKQTKAEVDAQFGDDSDKIVEVCIFTDIYGIY